MTTAIWDTLRPRREGNDEPLASLQTREGGHSVPGLLLYLNRAAAEELGEPEWITLGFDPAARMITLRTDDSSAVWSRRLSLNNRSAFCCSLSGLAQRHGIKRQSGELDTFAWQRGDLWICGPVETGAPRRLLVQPGEIALEDAAHDLGVPSWTLRRLVIDGGTPFALVHRRYVAERAAFARWRQEVAL